ncbi:MAG: SurA N-terminal domain-containing protein [Rhizomicrobium sp.]|jgi:peptidyl-prolyl cis-trans isomerase D
MLQQMRSFATSWFASIIIGIIAFSFAVWGIADIFTGNTDTSIATVGGEKVEPAAYQQQYQDLLRAQKNQTGHDVSADEAKRQGLPQQALDSLLSDVALANVVHKLGLETTDAQVAAYVHSISSFNGPLGTFDHTTFLQVLQQSGFTEQSFIDTVRAQNTRDQLAAAARNGLVLPAGYTHAILSYVNERRAVQYVELPASAVATPPAPDDATLSAYVAKHPERYSTPEYRDLTYATIGPNDLLSQVKVTPDQLRQQYDLMREDPQSGYLVPEKRDEEQITFPDLASAKAARAKIDAGTSFADIAKARGVTPTAIPGVVAGEDERSKAVFALPKGGVSQPIKSLAGWDLVEVANITPGVNKSFDDVKADLQKSVLLRLAAAKVQDIDNAYSDANSGGASLSEAAKKVGMKVIHIPAVDDQGLMPDGTKANVPTDPEVLQQIAKSDIGVEGDPFTTKDGVSYVLLVNGQTPPHLKPLDAVRAVATAAWQAQQQRTLLTEKAKALTADASKAGNLSGVAKALGATVQTSPALTRPAGDTTLPPGFDVPLLLNIFAAPPGSVVYGPDAKGDGYVIAKVTGVFHPPLPTFDPRYARFQAAMNARAGNDVAEAFAKAAKAQQGVTLHPHAIAQAMGS